MRYFIELSYKGTNYHGWQIQPDASSVQEEITKALATILQEKILLVGAGRTDAGVHASQMFAHVDTVKKLTDDYVHKLNAILPNDIVIKSIKEVSDETHARFDAVSRTYEYRILLGRDPFLLETSWQLHQKNLQIEKMNEAANLLFKYEDFESFSKVKTDVNTFNCSIMKAVWTLEDKHLIFHIKANRFLRNMVRAIVGTLIEVGLGKKTVEDFRKIIESKKRSEAGLSVPAKGLFLTEVCY
ncbi:tRNA pseudouridine(38-40) synthase TruA [Flavobacteriaceae bacterium]|nr:tRNA pseudouridine(38-40) synthase TruA [bacterium]MDB9927887.1 tRNA pseudouridine(38-40) synthase TruA [Flavobacteriaceae bacterium]MDB9956226.1 tRNA pseudouridine(38-40) synthase TruA [Flavobacteriaceae bacterium]MDC1343363.1 tRNA pseudouridine(38-40) synthase TruA [Flavobacteriaceae bacterium]